MACPKPASSLRARKRSCRPQLGAESFFYGLPKATLDTHGPRPQTLLGSRQACRGLSVASPKPEGNVRHPRAQPSNPPRQPAGLPRPLCGLSEACLFSSPTGPGRKRSCRPQLSPESFFSSEGDVRHPRGPPSNPPRQPAGLPRPLCGLSEACLFSSPTGPARKRSCRPQLGPESFFYGLPKATLDTHGPRPQTLLGSRQACRGLSEACLFSSPTGPARKRSCRPQLGPESFFYGLPKATLDTRGPRPQTLLGSRQACRGLSVACPNPASSLRARKRSCRPQLGAESFFYGLPKATLDTHGPRPQTLLGSRQACRGLSVASPKPASSLHPRAPPANVPAGRSLAQKAFSMGFRRQR